MLSASGPPLALRWRPLRRVAPRRPSAHASGRVLWRSLSRLFVMPSQDVGGTERAEHSRVAAEVEACTAGRGDRARRQAAPRAAVRAASARDLRARLWPGQPGPVGPRVSPSVRVCLTPPERTSRSLPQCLRLAHSRQTLGCAGAGIPAARGHRARPRGRDGPHQLGAEAAVRRRREWRRVRQAYSRHRAGSHRRVRAVAGACLSARPLLLHACAARAQRLGSACIVMQGFTVRGEAWRGVAFELSDRSPTHVSRARAHVSMSQNAGRLEDACRRASCARPLRRAAAAAGAGRRTRATLVAQELRPPLHTTPPRQTS